MLESLVMEQHQHVAVYARISQDPKDKRLGVKRQEDLCRRHAAEHWPDVPIVAYVDNDRSGVDAERPEYLRFLEAVKGGLVADVVTAEQSRLTRDPIEWERLVIVLSMAGIDKVHTLSGVVSVAEGNRLLGRIMADVAAEERDQTVRRIHRALDANAEKGAPAGGRPYGYRPVGEKGSKTYVIVPDEAKVITEIADRVIDGDALGAIVDDLNARGIPSARGGTWHATSAKAVVLKPAVAGYRVHKGDIIGTGNWSPIIDPDRWSQLTQILTGRRIVTMPDGSTRSVGAAKRAPYKRLLSGGLSICGNCGAPLVATLQGRRNGPSIPSYGCHRSSRHPAACSSVSMMANGDHLDPRSDDPIGLEELVVADVLHRISTPAVQKALRPLPDAKAQKVAVELANAEQTLESLGAMLGAGEIDPTAFKAAHDAARGRADQARSKLRAITTVPVDDDPASIPERWNAMPLSQRRRVVEFMVKRITVHKGNGGPRFDPDRVDIDWSV